MRVRGDLLVIRSPLVIYMLQSIAALRSSKLQSIAALRSQDRTAVEMERLSEMERLDKKLIKHTQQDQKVAMA